MVTKQKKLLNLVDICFIFIFILTLYFYTFNIAKIILDKFQSSKSYRQTSFNLIDVFIIVFTTVYTISIQSARWFEVFNKNKLDTDKMINNCQRLVDDQ
jgi:hypothetical protein